MQKVFYLEKGCPGEQSEPDLSAQEAHPPSLVVTPRVPAELLLLQLGLGQLGPDVGHLRQTEVQRVQALDPVRVLGLHTCCTYIACCLQILVEVTGIEFVNLSILNYYGT